MTVTATAPTTPAATTPAASTPGATGAAKSKTPDGLSQLTQNFQTFLTLLTTQLKNQDPLSPLDSNQFTQQLVQMSGVEAQLNTNDLLKNVVSNTGASVGTAVGLIGKDVRAASDAAQLSGGKAQWIYNLPTDATNVTLQVVNSAGQVVHAEAAAGKSQGDHTFNWNGKDVAGNTLPDGSYTLQIAAQDSAGKAVAPTIFVDGPVTAVEQQNGATLLTINGGLVPIASVTSVTNTAATAAAASPSSGSNPLSSILSSASSALGL